MKAGNIRRLPMPRTDYYVIGGLHPKDRAAPVGRVPRRPVWAVPKARRPWLLTTTALRRVIGLFPPPAWANSPDADSRLFAGAVREAFTVQRWSAGTMPS